VADKMNVGKIGSLMERKFARLSYLVNRKLE